MIRHDCSCLVAQRRTLVQVARSTAHYRPAPASAEGLVLMRQLYELHLELQFYAIRRLRDELEARGQRVSRKRFKRLMHQMRLAALYAKRRIAVSDRVHNVYLYRLPNPPVEQPNQAWAANICHLPMAKGFM